MTKKSRNKIAYLGPPGVGLGFELSGIIVKACESSRDMIKELKDLKSDGRYGIIFIDEGLAGDQLDAISYLNTDPLPAILLLPNPVNPQNLSAKSMKQLIVKAVGSDILK